MIPYFQLGRLQASKWQVGFRLCSENISAVHKRDRGIVALEIRSTLLGRILVFRSMARLLNNRHRQIVEMLMQNIKLLL